MIFRLTVLVLFGVLALSCGGGSSDENSSPDSTATEAAAAPSATPQARAPEPTRPAATATLAPEPTASRTSEPEPVNGPLTVARGDKLTIPSLGIEGSLVALKVSADGHMPDPEAGKIGIFDFSVASKALGLQLGGTPGLGGTAVFAGKHSTQDGPSVLFALYNASVGDIVEVTYQGQTFSYTISSLRDVPWRSEEWAEIVGAAEEETLILLTDKPGDFRLVVMAERLD